MALGRPVVATHRTGLSELITDGVDGFLIDPGDAAALATTVRTAVADEALLARVGLAARRRAGDFDLDKMVDRLVNVYADVLDGRGVAASATST
jgi:glycosyltransferase involved in cell wall biosynthesis